MSALRDLLNDGRVHVLDGAMGTVLYNKGVFVNVCYDEVTLLQPDLIESVHRSYVEAGAEVIETNTFGANPVKLSAHGLENRTQEINRKAVTIARAAANKRALVTGAIGPLGIRIEPWGPTSVQEVEALFQEQVRGLVDGGVDGFVLETFSDIDEILSAIRAVRSLSDLPIVAQMTVGDDERTSYGADLKSIAAKLSTSGIEAIGLNCSVGPALMLDAIETLAELTDLPISAQPNAGLPRAVGDRKIYLASPEYMGQYARRIIEAGARLIGGCCGTTPEHIQQVRAHVASLQPRQTGSHLTLSTQAPSSVEPVPLGDRSALGAKLASNTFVTTIELSPPKGWDPTPLHDAVRQLEGHDIDAVHILDSPRAQSRMGALPAALILKQSHAIETIVHYACRDRNMLGMVSDLLGAAGGGIRNVLLVTGDPPRLGPYPDATAVFDIDSIGLTNVVNCLNHGTDPGGTPLGTPTQFVVGVAANQCAVDIDREVERMQYKIEAGADFVVTQPVFDVDALLRFLDRIGPQRPPIIGGIWPLISLRNAEFLANEVPGVRVPESIMTRMSEAQAKSGEHASAEGVNIAVEIMTNVRYAVQGIQMSATPGGVRRALETLDSLK